MNPFANRVSEKPCRDIFANFRSLSFKVTRKRSSGRRARQAGAEVQHHPLRQAAPARSRDGRDRRAGHPGVPGRGVFRQSGVSDERDAGGEGYESGESGMAFTAVSFCIPHQ